MKRTGFDIFDNADEKTMEQLAKKTHIPKEKKEDMFAASMEKLRQMERAGTVDIAPQAPPVNTHYAGIKVRRFMPVVSAAACLIVVLGVSGVMLALKDNKTSERINSSDLVTSSFATAEKITSEDDTSSETDQSPEAESSRPDDKNKQSSADSEEKSPKTESKAESSKPDTEPQPEIITIYEDTTDNDTDDTQDNNEQQTEPENQTDKNDNNNNETDDKKDTGEHRTGDLPDEFVDKIEAAAKSLREDLKYTEFISNGLLDTDYSVVYDENFEPVSAASENARYIAVTDSRFSSTAEIKAYLSSKLTGSALSSYSKLVDEFYRDHNGKLYTLFDHTTEAFYDEWVDDGLSIYNMTETSFDFDAPFKARGGALLGKAVVSATLEGGSWKISKVQDSF